MKIVVALVSYDSVLYLVGRCAFDVVLFQTSFVPSPAYQAALRITTTGILTSAYAAAARLCWVCVL